jgi:hypothetical protein
LHYAHHYAAGWKTEGVIKPIPEVNDLGRRYAELPAGSAEKEALLLELCQCFHPYVMKYLVMICRGHVPVVGRGDKGAPINKDIKPFLLYFLPKGSSLDWHTMNVIVKHFHLAFKGMGNRGDLRRPDGAVGGDHQRLRSEIYRQGETLGGGHREWVIKEETVQLRRR